RDPRLGPGPHRSIQVPPPDLRHDRLAVHVQHEAQAPRGARPDPRDPRRRGGAHGRGVSLEPLERGATAMLVVELQNDLVHPSLVGTKGLSGKLAEAVASRGVLPRLASLLDRCREAGVPVLYLTKERHPSLPAPGNAPIYRTAGVTASKLVTGTWGAQ